MLEKIKKIPKICWLLLLVFIIGSAGIFYNYGRVAGGGGDEPLIVNSALKFFRDFSLADKYNAFLPGVIIPYIPFTGLILVIYFFLGVGDISQLKELIIVDTYKFIPYFRFITVIFGVITVYIFYRVCLEIFKKEKTALVASYLLATSLLFIQRIHTAGAWVIQTMIILISLYYSLILLKKEKWRVWDFIISAIFIVLAVEIETVGLIAVIPFFLVCWQRRRDIKMKQWIVNLSLFFLVIILGAIFFFYLNPFSFRGYFSIFNDAVQSGLSKTYYGRDIWGRIFDPLWVMILLEPLLFVLAVFGIIAALRTNKFLLTFLGLYALFYYLVFGPILGGISADCRLLLLIPVLAAFAAFFLDFLPKRVVYCCLLIFLINPLVFGAVLLKKNSVIEARKWINENIPADSRIFDGCQIELNENKNVLKDIEQNYPSFLTTRRKYLLDNSFILTGRKGYFVKDKNIVNTLKPENFQYLIICYFNDKERVGALESLGGAQKIKIYDAEANRRQASGIDPFYLTELSSQRGFGLFSLLDIPYPGPSLEIYMLK